MPLPAAEFHAIGVEMISIYQNRSQTVATVADSTA